MIQQPKPQRVTEGSYLAFVRKQPCILLGKMSSGGVGHLCYGIIEANHIRPEGHGGIGTKPDDKRALPFCTGSHRDYHDISRAVFELRWELDLEKEITLLNLEFSFQQKKLPLQRARNYKPEARVEIKHCVCNRRHLLPLSKVLMTKGAIVFRCPLSSKEVKVSA